VNLSRKSEGILILFKEEPAGKGFIG